MEVPFHFHFPFILVVFLVTFITLFMSKKPRKIPSSNTKGKLLPQPPGKLPIIGHLHLLGGQDTIARTLGAMAEKCGPIFSLRLGQHQTLVMSCWELVKDCFTNNDIIIATRPSMAVSKYLSYDYAAFFISPYGKYWHEMRKFSTVELLSTSKLEKMKHFRALEINSWIKNLYKECTKTGINCQSGKISLDKWFEYCTSNIVLHMIVGKSFSRESYDESGTFASRFNKAIHKATYLSGVPVPSDFIPALERMDFLGYISSMKEIHKEIDMIIGHWVDEHIQKIKECQGRFIESDFMDVMISKLEEDRVNSGYTKETIIKATALTLLLTGSESTSITLTWVISLLLNHPKALKAAQEEINLTVGKQRWVEEVDITNLPYLQAIVKETLRLYPPSPLTGPREATQDCHIGGHLIPKGTRLLVNIWKLHRDPRVWASPDQFRPERFLDEHRSVGFRGQHFEYIPFSLGRRSCPGMGFGLQVVHLMLARLVQGFDIRSEDGGPVDMSEGLGLALPKESPLNVVLATRLPTNLYEAL